MNATAQWVNHQTMAHTWTDLYFYTVAVRWSSDVILWMSFTLSLFLLHQSSAPSLQTKIKGLDRNDKDWEGPYSQSRKNGNRIGNQKHGLSIQSHSLQYNHFCLQLIIKKQISLMVEKQKFYSGRIKISWTNTQKIVSPFRASLQSFQSIILQVWASN